MILVNRKERIELHCHTKSGGNAIMYAGEVIRMMSSKDMPAIAFTDESSILSFAEIEDVMKYGEYAIKPIFGMELYVDEGEGTEPSVISVLIKNEQGKEGIYKLFTENDSRQIHPIFKFDDILAIRDNLLIGTGPESSILYKYASAPDEKLLAIIKQYDYVEILPYEEHKDANKRFVELAASVGVPVVAISDARYLYPEDRKAWSILNYYYTKEYDSRKKHIFSTDEMLEAFSYLGDEKAYEIVVDNTHKLADMCEMIHISPTEKCYPAIEDADTILRDLCESTIVNKYDESIVDAVKERLDFELSALKNTDMSSTVLVVKELFEKAKLRACDVSCRGLAVGSLVMYLLDLSEIDPIKYRLEPELIFGYDGSREIDIDINLPPRRRGEINSLLKKLDCVGHAATAGVINVVSEKIAEGMLDVYEQDTNQFLLPEERERIKCKLTGNYRGRGEHPGGQIIFPKNSEYEKMTPFVKLQDGKETTYFAYFSIDKCFVKLDLLEHSGPEKLAKLAERTGVDIADVPYDTPELYSLFVPDESGELVDCAELPDFSSEYVRELVKQLKPTTFDELVKIISISHGTGSWLGNGQALVEDKSITLKQLISNRDDIFNYLLDAGIERFVALQITEAVRKGMVGRTRFAKWNSYKQLLKDAGVPDWYIWSCEQVKYLFPRAHTISYLMMDMRLGWYKLHYPAEFAAVMKEYEVVE